MGDSYRAAGRKTQRLIYGNTNLCFQTYKNGLNKRFSFMSAPSCK